MSHVLVHWDDSGDGWKLHAEADGAEVGGPWSEDPRRRPDLELEMRQAMAEDDLPGDSDPPSAARQARGMAVASIGLRLGGKSFIRESSDTPFPWQ